MDLGQCILSFSCHRFFNYLINSSVIPQQQQTHSRTVCRLDVKWFWAPHRFSVLTRLSYILMMAVNALYQLHILWSQRGASQLALESLEQTSASPVMAFSIWKNSPNGLLLLAQATSLLKWLVFYMVRTQATRHKSFLCLLHFYVFFIWDIAGLGSDAHLFFRGSTVLRRGFDPFITETLMLEMGAHGPTLHPERTPLRIERDASSGLLTLVVTLSDGSQEAHTG